MTSTALAGPQIVKLPEAPADLGSNDRCDRCSAAALARITLSSGGELVFCGHHLTRNRDELEKAAVKIEDWTDSINVRPSVSTNVA